MSVDPYGDAPDYGIGGTTRRMRVSENAPQKPDSSGQSRDAKELRLRLLLARSVALFCAPNDHTSSLEIYFGSKQECKAAMSLMGDLFPSAIASGKSVALPEGLTTDTPGFTRHLTNIIGFEITKPDRAQQLFDRFSQDFYFKTERRDREFTPEASSALDKLRTTHRIAQMDWFAFGDDPEVTLTCDAAKRAALTKELFDAGVTALNDDPHDPEIITVKRANLEAEIPGMKAKLSELAPLAPMWTSVSLPDGRHGTHALTGNIPSKPLPKTPVTKLRWIYSAEKPDIAFTLCKRVKEWTDACSELVDRHIPIIHKSRDNFLIKVDLHHLKRTYPEIEFELSRGAAR